MKNYILKNRWTLMVLMLCLFIVGGLFFYAQSSREKEEGARISYTRYERAKVVSVVSSDVENEPLYENAPVGSQQIQVLIQSGSHKGETYTASNFIGSLYGSVVKEGDPVVVAMYFTNDTIKTINIYEYNRTGFILLLVVIFVLVTIAIGGKKGALSLLGLSLSILALIFILLPLLYKGFRTIPTTLFICILIAIISYTLLEGVTKKTITAMLGTTLGLLFSLGFGLFAQYLVKVDGMKMGDYIDALLQLKQTGTPIQLRGLLMGGMMIASLGAIMDVAMSIASSVQELVTVNPSLDRKSVIRSGMNIGRDMIGTMTNTLILAFVGSSFVLVMYIYSLGIPAYELLSSTLVATQMVHSLASSIGVILSVPLTVVLSSLIYCKRK